MTSDEPSDAERYPTLGEHGHRMLRFLREHPHAPIYRNLSGNRLSAADVERVRAFERQVSAARVELDRTAPWIDEFVQRCFEQVPFYRRLGSPPSRLEHLPTVSRADLSRDIAAFVPDDAPLDRLINFRTSGTTGHPLLLASHPVVSASYLAFHKRALRRFGIELSHGRGQVGVVLIGYQRQCFTYVSVTPTMDDSGLAKINLHPNDWRHPDDRAKYLDDLGAELFTGDPLSFAELLRLPTRARPKALLSTSMALGQGLRAALEQRFGCPVLDVYSMNEAGPIAVFDPAASAHVLLQPRLHVEILSPEGAAVEPGERGEITVTGGFNFCLPLLRYRTGDHAALSIVNSEPALLGLEGRPPVRFRATSGEWLNNIEVTRALARFALAQYALEQRADESFRLSYAGFSAAAEELAGALRELFGADAAIELEEIRGFDGKIVQYTSALEGSVNLA